MIYDCKFRDNNTDAIGFGGAIYTPYGSNKTKIYNTLFCYNAANCGGALAVEGGLMEISNCSFHNNEAKNRGGAVYINTTLGGFINCGLYRNKVTTEFQQGGATFISESILVFNSCSIAENFSAGTAGGIYNSDESSIKLSNCIIGKNTSATYAPDLYGSFSGEYNLISDGAHCEGLEHGENNNMIGTESFPIDPQFGSLVIGGDIHYLIMRSSSPAINTGNPEAPEQDIFSNWRNGIPDRGCYEYMGCSSLPEIEAEANYTELCEGFPLILSGSGGVRYEWSEGITDNEPFILESTGKHIFTVKGYDENGCADSAEIKVKVYSTPAPEILPLESNTICNTDNPITIKAQPETGYFRGEGLGSSVVEENPSGPHRLVTEFYPDNMEPGRYTISYSLEYPYSGGCTVSDSIEITLNDCTENNVTALQAHEVEWLKIIPVRSAPVWLISSENPDEIINTVRVFDMAGRILINESNLNSPEYRLELQNMSNAIYLIQVKTTSKFINEKILQIN